jgi:hypothetical protein
MVVTQNLTDAVRQLQLDWMIRRPSSLGRGVYWSGSNSLMGLTVRKAVDLKDHIWARNIWI